MNRSRLARFDFVALGFFQQQIFVAAAVRVHRLKTSPGSGSGLLVEGKRGDRLPQIKRVRPGELESRRPSHTRVRV